MTTDTPTSVIPDLVIDDKTKDEIVKAIFDNAQRCKIMFSGQDGPFPFEVLVTIRLIEATISITRFNINDVGLLGDIHKALQDPRPNTFYALVKGTGINVTEDDGLPVYGYIQYSMERLDQVLNPHKYYPTVTVARKGAGVINSTYTTPSITGTVTKESMGCKPPNRYMENYIAGKNVRSKGPKRW